MGLLPVDPHPVIQNKRADADAGVDRSIHGLPLAADRRAQRVEAGVIRIPQARAVYCQCLHKLMMIMGGKQHGLADGFGHGLACAVQERRTDRH